MKIQYDEVLFNPRWRSNGLRFSHEYANRQGTTKRIGRHADSHKSINNMLFVKAGDQEETASKIAARTKDYFHMILHFKERNINHLCSYNQVFSDSKSNE